VNQLAPNSTNVAVIAFSTLHEIEAHRRVVDITYSTRTHLTRWL